MLEDDADWIKRVKQDAEDARKAAGRPDWVDECRVRNWRWCGQLCRQSDGRWTQKLVAWTPTRGIRNQGHPCLRQLDDVHDFLSTLFDKTEIEFEEWQSIAQDMASWENLESQFVKHCCAKGVLSKQ